MKVALTGVTGNMGVQALRELIKLPDVQLKLLVFPKEKRLSEIKKICKGQMKRVQFVYGSVNHPEVCDELVSGTDYVVNMASVIPPHSDRSPLYAIACNEKGADCLCTAIESLHDQPKLIHISTVAL